MDTELAKKAVATIRTLSIDGVEKANSGHPGTPMALAQIALAIWMDHLRYDPADPRWPGRDRFVLSCGHASMLLYSMLHLSGYDVSLDDLKSFRQWGSKTPGHPEFHLTPGVETTTGPLGQGISNAVGMALSLKMLAARTNDKVSPGRVFGICSDGDLMEGVSAEASSLAGHLGLDNLVFFYDDNKITIDGATSLAFSEDVAKRYEAYGWATWHIDGHDDAQIKKALAEAVALKGKPALIVARTHIGIGAPHKHDSNKAHGEPLGADEIKLVKKDLGWPEDASFLVPEEVYALFRERAKAGKAAHAEWQRDVEDFKKNGGEKAALYEKLMKREVPANLLEELVKAAPTKEAATRASSGVIEQRLAALVPSFVGGSADLNPSTKTYIEGSPAIERGAYEGRNIHFGIREHAMGAIVNGMAMSDAFIPFGSTFLIFSDYMRPTLRLAALSHVQSLFVYTHDSVYLGEDGPTHQPVEQYATIRMMPNCDFVRPCDALECAAAWTMALDRRDGPTVIALSRQNLPPIPRPNGFDPKTMMRGAYVIADADKPTLVLIATGSEVSLAVEAKKLLDQKGDRVRVVSVLCYERFEREDEAYRKSVLPPGVVRVSIEIGSTAGWRGVVGDTGLTIGLDHYGASAPAKVIAKEFGFVPEAIVKKIEAFRAR